MVKRREAFSFFCNLMLRTIHSQRTINQWGAIEYILLFRGRCEHEQPQVICTKEFNLQLHTATKIQEESCKVICFTLFQKRILFLHFPFFSLKYLAHIKSLPALGSISMQPIASIFKFKVKFLHMQQNPSHECVILFLYSSVHSY